MDDPAPLTDAENLMFANMLNAIRGPVRFSCRYRNWRGEVSTRRLEMREIHYGSTEWHPEPCLLLRALDLDKNALRDFRVADFDIATLTAIKGEAISHQGVPRPVLRGTPF